MKILQILKGRVDGLEAQQNEFEAGGFSDTTTMDGKANFLTCMVLLNSEGKTDGSESNKLMVIHIP